MIMFAVFIVIFGCMIAFGLTKLAIGLAIELVVMLFRWLPFILPVALVVVIYMVMTKN